MKEQVAATAMTGQHLSGWGRKLPCGVGRAWCRGCSGPCVSSWSTLSSRHEELDRLARERDAVLASVKSAHTEQLQALEARVVELQVQCEALELQLRRAEWRQMDALKEKDATLDK